MKVTLYMAMSIDGYIAKTDGDSDWISDQDIAVFDERCTQADAIIVGNTTYEQFKGEIYPIAGKINIVVSSKSFGENTAETFYAHSPKNALEIAKNKNAQNVLLVGGGTVNSAFLQDNLIDEIVVDIQPIILGEGIKLFEEFKNIVEVKFIEHIGLDGGLNILRYLVKK